MKVVVREAGTRPAVLTAARLNAPQGARALADLLADETFADMSVITIDWVGDTFTPVMYVDTIKWFIEFGGKRLEHKWIVNLEDAFGLENMNNAILRQMVADLREEFLRASQTQPPGYNK